MVAVNQIRDEYRLEATAVGVEKTTAAAEGLAAATDKVTVSTEKQERKVISVQRALERFAASNDQAFRAQQQVERAQQLVNRAFEQGLSGTYAYERATAALIDKQAALARVTAQAATANDNSAAKTRAAWSALSAQGVAQEKTFQSSEKLAAGWGRLSAQGAAQARTIQGLDAAQTASTKTTGLHAGAWQNLGFQANDALTMLASGSSAFQVLATQGGQVYQILDGPKGVTGGLKEVGNFLLGLLTPARILIGGLAGIGVTAIAAAMSWRSTQSEVQQALSGVGRAAGVTAGELEGIAEASAAASNTSVGAARSLALELAKTGRIARDNLAPIAALGKNFAATLGLDATEGNAQLARSFAEPGKGAEELARRYGLLSDATARYIQHLEDSNERGRAQQVLIDALRPKLVNAAELTTGWAYAWDKVSTAARNAWDWIGKATDKAMGGTGGGTDEEVRKALEERLRYQQSAAGRAASSRGGDLDASNRAIAETQRQLTALEQRTTKARADAQDTARNLLSQRAGFIASAVAPELKALDELRAKRKTLADDMANQGAGPGTKEQAVALARLDAQIRDYTEAGGAMELQERKRAAASQLVLDAMKARTPAEVGAIAASKTLNDAMGTATFQAERNAQAERERAQATAAAQKALDDQSGAVQRNTESNGHVADAWRRSGEGAAMYAESVRKAAEDVESRGLPADQKLARQQAYLREQLSEQIKERDRAIAQKNQEAKVDENLARLVDQQVVSHEQASQQRQRDLDVARLQSLAAVAEGEQRTALLRQVDELTAAYGRENTVRAERAAQGMIADQGRELAQLRLEAELVGKSTIERERALAVLRAQQELQRQGIALSSEKGQTYIDNAAMLSDIRTAKTQFERLAQDVSSVVSGIFDDMFKAGNKGLAGFFDSFARGFARIGTRLLEQNLIAPLVTSAMGGGSGAAGAGANLFGSFDFGKIEKAVSEGSFSGIMESFGDLLKPGSGGGKGTGFASTKLGGGLMSAGVGASIGYQSQSPLIGALGGAASGYAMGGPVGGVVGGIAGLLGGLFGKSQAKKEAQKKLREQLEAYKEAYREAEPEIKKLEATFRGESVGAVGGQIDAAFQQAVQANKTASQAGDQKRADSIMQDFVKYAWRLRDVFMNAFEGTLSEVAAGFGTSGPFAQANAAVATLGESLKAFVKDSESLPQAEANSARARAAAQQAALAALDPPKALSDTQSRLAAIQGTAAGLSRVLQDLGMSADEAATAIRDRTAKAMDALRAQFSADLGAKINEAAGKSYLNDIADLVKERDGLLADARAIGADTAQVGRYFTLAAQKIVDGSELTGDAFTALVRQFPALQGAVVEFGQAVDTAAAKAEAAARALGYQDRTFAAGTDTSTLSGALAAQDRKAAADRLAEAKAGGQAMAELEQALAAERAGILKDFATRAAEAEKAAAEATARRVLSAEDRIFAARNDASTLTGKLAEMERQHARERAEEVAAGGQALAKLEEAQAAERLKVIREAGEAEVAARKQALAEAQTFLDGATKSIRSYLDGLKAGPETNLSPGARLKEAQAQFDAQAKLAKGGDRDALGSITTYADRLLDAGKGMYASGKDYQAILAAVTKQLGALPSQVSAEQFVVDAIKAQTTALQAAVATGSAAETAKALAGSFDKLTASTNGLLSQKDFLAALGPKATVAEQQAALAVFRSIDLDGDNQLSKLELTRAQLKGAIEANSPALIQKALSVDFGKLDKNVDGLLSPAEFLAGLGPLATKAEQAAATVWLKAIDTNGDGQISALELLRGQMVTALTVGGPQAMATAIKTGFPKVDINKDGLLSSKEFLAALGPLASKAEQQAALAVFRSIDLDGDGQISKLEALRTSLGSNVTGIDNVAKAIKDNFARLDRYGAGGLSVVQFKEAFGPLATQADQKVAEAYFKSIDADGDGIISKLELARSDLGAAIKANSAGAIATALNANFDTLAGKTNGGITKAQFDQSIAGLATKAEQAAAYKVFQAIDADGDGIITKTEAVRAELLGQLRLNDPSKIASALSANFAILTAATNGQLTSAQLLAGLGPLATKADQATALKVFQSIDADGNGIITAIEAANAAIAGAVKANNASAFAGALQANFATLDRSVNGVLDKDELAAAIRGLATIEEQRTATGWMRAIDTNGDLQISQAELTAARVLGLQSLTSGTTKAVTDVKASSDTGNKWAEGANINIRDGNATAKGSQGLLDALRSLSGDQKALLGLIRGSQDTARDTLASIRASSVTQDNQLVLLNRQFTVASPVAVYGTNYVLSNNMLDALNKIVFNTGQTVSAFIKLMSVNRPDGLAYAFADGGWVRGPGSGTSDSIGARLSNGEFVVNAAAARLNAPFLEAMNDNPGLIPAVPVPVMGGGMDVGALLAELQALRAEVRTLRTENKAGQEMQARITKAGADKIAGKVEETTDEVAGSRDDNRKAAAPMRAGRGEPVKGKAA